MTGHSHRDHGGLTTDEGFIQGLTVGWLLAVGLAALQFSQRPWN
ncbi:hypothetical protein [Vasconcelosia minhoensis]|nr:hypothetical protein [Romeria gracilis]